MTKLFLCTINAIYTRNKAINKKKFIIIGGTSGFGYAAASILINEGAIVSIIGRNHARACAKAMEIGANCYGFGSENGIADAIENAIIKMGGIDGIAITAGPIEAYGNILDLKDEDWQQCFDTHIMTLVKSLRFTIPKLIENGGGNIVTISAYSVRSQKEHLPHYAAMKSAIVSITKNIAKFYGKDNIRANCIAPGAIATEALDNSKGLAVAEYGGDETIALNRYMTEKWGMKVAQNRVGQPHEVGELIAFLLSKKANYMTGALINIDGGTDF